MNIQAANWVTNALGIAFAVLMVPVVALISLSLILWNWIFNRDRC